MNPLAALIYSFLFGLLHGILPDEHMWPITFSYAIAGGSGKEGMKAGLYFSAAFTLQRAIVSELAWLVLAPFLLDPAVNGIVYIVVGIAMSAAGALVLRRGRYFHVHVFGHCHGEGCEMERTGRILAARHEEPPGEFMVPPARWTRVTQQEVRCIGAGAGGRTLFYGGILFGAAGVAALTGLDRRLGFDTGYAVIALFIIAVAIPAFISSWREVMAVRKRQQTGE